MFDYIDLNKVVVLDEKRSYRDGNLMFLNFGVVDKDNDLLFSFYIDCDRFTTCDDDMVCELFNTSYDGKNFNAELCLSKLYLTSLRKNYHPFYSASKLKNTYSQVGSFVDFAYLVMPAVIRQTKKLVNAIDFFSLQTKEDYILKRDTVRANIMSIKDKVCSYDVASFVEYKTTLLKEKKLDSWSSESIDNMFIDHCRMNNTPVISMFA